MIIKNASFSKTVLLTKDLPKDGLNELVLAGRSNVGKSSFINSVTNNQKLARVSKVPGKTVTLNFYLINNEFYFVDVPGYGYAEREHNVIVDFGTFVEEYIKGRKELKGFIQIIDSRNVTENDKTMVKFYIKHNINFFIVLSKIDKLKRNDIQKRINETAAFLMINPDLIIPYSSLTLEHKNDVLEKIESLLK